VDIDSYVLDSIRFDGSGEERTIFLEVLASGMLENGAEFTQPAVAVCCSEEGFVDSSRVYLDPTCSMMKIAGSAKENV